MSGMRTARPGDGHTPASPYSLNDLTVSPFDGDGSLSSDMGEIKTVDDAPKLPFAERGVLEVLYHGESGGDWDGTEAVVLRLNDGRYAAWQTWWDVTGNGFWEDAYGGGQDIWVGHDLKKLILEALDDTGRELCGIPRAGL